MECRVAFKQYFMKSHAIAGIRESELAASFKRRHTIFVSDYKSNENGFRQKQP